MFSVPGGRCSGPPPRGGASSPGTARSSPRPSSSKPKHNGELFVGKIKH